MSILGPLPKTRTGSKYIVVVTDRYSKLTRAIRTKTTAASDVTPTFINDRVISYGIPDRLLTDKESQFVGNLFNAARDALGTKLMKSVPDHPQINAQTERYNQTIVS